MTDINYREEYAVKFTKIGEIAEGQDGAIWNKLLFRFDHKGECHVHDLDTLQEVAQFCLDDTDTWMPHSNAVMFGCEYFAEGDEFPLLYTNVYNTYSKEDDRREGVCCVYRITRQGDSFRGQLVQTITVGFTKDANLWCSENGDLRPYGNFVIDREREIYYGFTMRDACRTTRYFSFKMPKLADGVVDEAYGVKKVTLQVSDVLDYFDCDYHKFIQGACTHGGKIYSVEGFNDDPNTLAAIRVIDPTQKKQLLYKPFTEFGTSVEPEFIDFHGEACIYSDAHGNIYTIEF